MQTFATPAPITAKLELAVGDVRVLAAERADTLVDVQPSDPSRAGDVAAAERAQVEYADGMLLVKIPKKWGTFGGRESVDIKVEMPSRSHLNIEAGVASVRCAGVLGECRFRTGAGDITVARTGRLDVSTGSGAVRVERAGGPTNIRNGNGDIWIGESGAELDVKAANGRIQVDHAEAPVTAKTANGDIRLEEVAQGTVVAKTACGNVDVGVRPGVATWLDLHTSFGHVRNGLEATDGPVGSGTTVELQARTSFGDITVRHATEGAPAAPAAPAGNPGGW